MMKMPEIEPTPEDWEHAKAFLERDPREAFMESLARTEARKRVARERLERRRRLLNRLSLGLLARS
jgi:hypothetical protein